MAKEIRIPTENPNIFYIQRENGGLLETLKEVTSTTGEEDITVDGEIKKTQETITITRTTLNTVS